MNKRGYKTLRLAVIFGILITIHAVDLSADAQTQIEDTIAQMSREEKTGQMLVVSPAQMTETKDWTADMDTVIRNVEAYHIGGILLFAEDLQKVEAVKSLTASLADQGNVPVLIMADPSGNLKEGLTKPSLDKKEDDAAILGTGQLMTGENATWAYSLAEKPSEELAALGVAVEIRPEAGEALAVVTHEKVTNPMDDGRPASMSKSMVTMTLKEVFLGAVMTDSLSMTSAEENYGADMAVMYALQAGADILTTPEHPVNAYYGILSAIDEQLVTEAQIDASVDKVLELKKTLGLLQ